jgi:epoxyqueuosine reductase QueG
MNLVELLELDQSGWLQIFGNNQIARREPDAIRQNALIACGNLGLQRSAKVLKRYTTHPQPLLRSAAAWSLGRLHGSRSRIRVNSQT